jgi:hypothetical protein
VDGVGWLPLDDPPPLVCPDVQLPDCPVANTITVTTDSFSQFALGAAPASGSSSVTITGASQGGRVELSVGAITVGVDTSFGQTAADVALALAAAINADPDLITAGITASADGGEVTTNGVITSYTTDDPGLTLGYEPPAPIIPSLWAGGVWALALLLLAATAAMLGRPSRRRTT